MLNSRASTSLFTLCYDLRIITTNVTLVIFSAEACKSVCYIGTSRRLNLKGPKILLKSSLGVICASSIKYFFINK